MEIFENTKWLYNNGFDIWVTVSSTLLIYLAVIIITRINGLRTFAKMGSFDFAITIAIGSLIATVIITEEQNVAEGVAGLVTLIALQFIVAKIRRRNNEATDFLTNTPLLLMRNGIILKENMKASRVSEADLYEKLRAENVTDPLQVHAVVLETTGDISVLHKNESNTELKEEMLSFVSAKVH